MAKNKFDYTFGFETFGRYLFRAAAWYFKVNLKMPKNVKGLNEPYILLSNHVGSYDPFIVGTFIKEPLHWIASDAVLREPVIGWFLRNFGVIPKKKNVRDSSMIRDIITVIRSGESVGLFPEGVRSWSGNSLPFDPSIAKLVRMLKVPVVVANLKGMSLSNPRWVFKPRKTEMTELEFKIILTKQDLKEKKEDEIFSILQEGLSHNEIEWQREHKVEILSDVRAEHIGFSLYICPECNNINTFEAKGNSFRCNSCDYDIDVDKHGFFSRPNKEDKLHFDNLGDWYDWEENYLSELVVEKFKLNSLDPIFTDKGMNIFKAISDKELEEVGTANVSFYIDRIELDYENGKKQSFFLNKLIGISPQFKESIELFYEEDAYRFKAKRNGVSGIKYEVVANTLWSLSGESFKQVPYVNVAKH